MTEQAIATRPKAAVTMNERGVSLRSMDDMARFAQTVAQSGLAPRGLDTPQKVFVAVETGLEAGLTPMAALRSLYVVQGMPAWYGKAAKALILGSGRCQSWDQGVSGSGEDRIAWVESVREGLQGKKRTEFSAKDAKRMRLWGKTGPWSDDPERMLMWRAVGRHAADWYQDVLMGLPLVEEAADWPTGGNGRTETREPEPSEEPDPLFEDIAPEASTDEPQPEPEPDPKAEEGPEDPTHAQTVITGVRTMSGKKNGQKVTYYVIDTGAGEFVTLDETIADVARSFSSTGEEALISFKPTGRGGREATAIDQVVF